MEKRNLTFSSLRSQVVFSYIMYGLLELDKNEISATTLSSSWSLLALPKCFSRFSQSSFTASCTDSSCGAREGPATTANMQLVERLPGCILVPAGYFGGLCCIEWSRMLLRHDMSLLWRLLSGNHPAKVALHRLPICTAQYHLIKVALTL